MYFIYHIPDFIHRDGSKGKIGCSKNVERRIKENKKLSYGPFEFWEVLETHTDKATASRRERELQEEWGYTKDKKSYSEVTSMPTKKSRSKGGKIGGKIVSARIHTCPHCGKTGKSNAMLQWHFENCKLQTEKN